MNQKSSSQQTQAEVSEQEAQLTQPQVLDLNDLEKVSGGLPRGGGGWVEAGIVIDQLPRGGGGWY